MKKLWSLIMMAIPLTGLIIATTLFFITANDHTPPQTYAISVIIRGPQSQYWDSIKLGMDEAAYDLNVDLTYETLLNYDDMEEQLSVIQREQDNNTQAIVLAPVSKEIYPRIKAYNDQIPIIEIESDTNADNIFASIYPDNFMMGFKIGQIVSSKYRAGQKLIFIKDNTGAPYIQEREKGFYSALIARGIEPLVWASSSGKVMTTEEIKSKIILEQAHMIVALDAVGLRNAAGAASATENRRIKVFGIDCTDEIITLIEQGVVDSTIAQNTFNMGYLSVQSAVAALNKSEPGKDVKIEHTIATIENLYSKNNEHIIFPIVK